MLLKLENYLLWLFVISLKPVLLPTVDRRYSSSFSLEEEIPRFRNKSRELYLLEAIWAKEREWKQGYREKANYENGKSEANVLFIYSV